MTTEKVTFEKAKQVADELALLPEFQYPAVNGIGITKVPLHEDGEYAVLVLFVGEKPSVDLPESVSDVKIVYNFNCGEVVAL